MSRPRITIGMPVYNEARYLRSALDSLLAQDFAEFEIAISDNASFDATPDICHEYVVRDSRVRVVRQPKNLGAVENARRTLQMARGEFFLWAAGHDVWRPEFLSACLAALEADAGCVLAYTRVGVVDAEGWLRHVETQGLQTLGKNRFERVRATLLAHGRIAVNDMFYGLIRTDALRKVRFLPVWGFDQLLTVELSLAGTFAHIQPCLYLRRANSGRTEDLSCWTDDYLRRLAPGLGERRVRLTYTQMGWWYARIVLGSSFSAWEKLQLLAVAARTMVGRHLAGILFHDIASNAIRLLFGSAATDTFRRVVYRLLRRDRPGREPLQPGVA